MNLGQKLGQKRKMAGLLRPLVNKNHYFTISKNGRSGGIRTHDPFTPSKVRYQAALRSDTGRLYAPPQHRAIPFRQE